MEKVTQLSVAMQNIPGQLERLCRILAQAGVNIRAISVSDATDLSTIRLLVSDPGAAQEALREAGLPPLARDVLAVELDDKPGALGEVASQLGRSGINIQYVYGSGDSSRGKAVLVFGVDDVDRARQSPT